MRMTQKLIAVAGLIGVACLAVAAPPEEAPVSRAVPVGDAVPLAPRGGGTSYELLVDSMYAQGCMGSLGGKLGYGCMCPIYMAEKFAGSFTLTPNWHTPPGHRAYDVTVEDWFVLFDGEEIEVVGDGFYDRWTDMEGDHWHAMMLDVFIDGEEVHLSSGLVEDPTPWVAIPSSISISLSSEPACFGYWFILDADRMRRKSGASLHKAVDAPLS